MNKKYDVAAYVWPAYTGNEMRTKIFWPEGIGEWQSVKNSAQKANGYNWGRKPVWGYVNEADPYVMAMQIDAASDYGVNTFIYDWYWYDHRPFLENCLNDGFLKAKNNNKMKFYLMWANHDANYTWDKRNSSDSGTVVWSGKVDKGDFEVIGRRWIENYFSHPSYYKIDGKPVISIYDLENLIGGLGGLENTRAAMKSIDSECKSSGFNGIHYQLVKWGSSPLNLSGVDSGTSLNPFEIAAALEFSSITHYQFAHFVNINKSYDALFEDVFAEWEKVRASVSIPYFPHISVGWDNNPRFNEFRADILHNNTPENFEKLLLMAKDYTDKYNNIPLITLNSWNEWTETSYLQPDNKYGYGYLEAVKKAFI